MEMRYEAKIIDATAGAVSAVLMGDGRIGTNVLPAYINTMAEDGWRMVFMQEVMWRHIDGDPERLMVKFKRGYLKQSGRPYLQLPGCGA